MEPVSQVVHCARAIRVVRIDFQPEGRCFRLRGREPNLHFIVAGRCQTLAVRGERHQVRRELVILERKQLLAGDHVPEARGPVCTARQQGLVVGRECHGSDNVRMSLE